MLLNGEPVQRRVRQPGLQRRPMLAVVEREVQAVFHAEIEEPFSNRILADAVRVTVNALRQIAGNRLPGAAIIRRLVNERIAVVHLVQVHGDVRRAVVVARRFDIGDSSPRRQVGDVRGHVRPSCAGIARDLNLTVVRPGPDHPLLFRRLGDREHHAGVLHADVVGSQSAGDALLRLVAGGEVGTDRLPALTAVRGPVHVLAAGINRVVIVRRDGQRKRPVEPVFDTSRGCAHRHFGPDFHFACLMGALVEPLDRAAQAAESGAGRPDDVVVRRIGNRPSAFAAGHGVPHPTWNRSARRAFRLLADPAVARVLASRTRSHRHWPATGEWQAPRRPRPQPSQP